MKNWIAVVALASTSFGWAAEPVKKGGAAVAIAASDVKWTDVAGAQS